MSSPFLFFFCLPVFVSLSSFLPLLVCFSFPSPLCLCPFLPPSFPSFLSPPTPWGGGWRWGLYSCSESARYGDLTFSALRGRNGVISLYNPRPACCLLWMWTNSMKMWLLLWDPFKGLGMPAWLGPGRGAGALEGHSGCGPFTAFPGLPPRCL